MLARYKKKKKKKKKKFVCLSVCLSVVNFDPNHLKTGRTE